RMSSVGSSVSDGTPWSFFSLVAAGAADRKSATAAAISNTSQSSKLSVHTLRSSAAVPTSITFAPRGGATVAFAAITVTSAPRRQQREVRVGRRVQVHALVHRRGEGDRARGRERSRGQQIVGMPVGQLGDRVGARRGDQVHVGALDERQVADRGTIRERLSG